jgi:hypothetical protein
MRNLIARTVILVLSVTLGAVAPACSKGAPQGDEPIGAEVPKGGAGATPAPASAGTADYFKDATGVPGKLKAKVGGSIRLLELALYPDHVEAQIQDPKKHDNADAYELRDGQIGDPEPIKFAGTTPSAKELDEATFDLGTIDFGAVAKMVKDAPAQLKLDGGKVTHMVLKRGRPFNDDVRWRVFVSGPRKDGSVEYDPAGSVKKVWN